MEGDQKQTDGKGDQEVRRHGPRIIFMIKLHFFNQILLYKEFIFLYLFLFISKAFILNDKKIYQLFIHFDNLYVFVFMYDTGELLYFSLYIVKSLGCNKNIFSG